MAPVAHNQTDNSGAAALKQARQLVVVVTKDWNVVDGELQRYERAQAGQPWQSVGAKIPIVVGRTGLAWGRGLHEAGARNGPVKKEGDGKSPAGIFKLTAAFGYAPMSQAKRVKLPYTQARTLTQCVDDAQSAFYNKIVERGQIARPDWKSHEDMLRKDELYRWGVVVEHNGGGVGGGGGKATAGGGSCIFLHIWSGPGKGTAGCTALRPELLEEMLYWLDPQRQPLLVQLPKAEYERLRSAWKLPS
jgi:D-alanyl-D-alanine dipeptidase